MCEVKVTAENENDMKLKNIKAENVKGRKIDIAFAPVTVFVGPSFSGKTAILDSIKLGLLGYHPKLGRRSSAAFALCGTGTGMSVEVELDRRTLTHTWEMVSGSVRYSGPAKMPLIPAVLMDTKEYFQLSRPDRLKYIFERTTVKDPVTAADVTAALKTDVKVEPVTADSEAAIVEAVAMVNELEQARVDEDVSVQVWLETILEQFKAAAKESADTVKRMLGLVQGTVELKAASGTGTGRLVNVDAELTDARKKLEAGRIALDRDQRAAAVEADRLAKIETLKSRISESEKSGPVEVDAEAITSMLVPLEKATVAYKSATIDRNKLVVESRQKMNQAAGDAARIKNEIAETEDRHAEAMKLKCCPFCKSDKAGWQKAIVAAHKELIALKTDALETARASLKKHETDLAKRVKLLAASEEDDGEHEARLEKISALVAKREAIRGRKDKMAGVRGELAGLEAMAPAAVMTRAQLDELQAAVGTYKQKVDALELAQKRYVAATQAEAQKAQAQAELEKQKGRAAVFKQAVEVVRAKQQKLVDGAIESLMATARKFTDGIMPGQLAYKDGELGYWSGSTWIGHDTFSGTEEALAYAAFSVALASESEVRLVMLDELGVADKETKLRILDRMVELVEAGVVEQFIGADVTLADYPSRPRGRAVTVIPVNR